MKLMIELIGFFALGLNIWGNWALTKKDARGWWLRIICNIAQAVYAALIWSPSYFVSAIIFLGINIVGIKRWKK